MTQRVARHLYEAGAKAVRYISRFGCEYRNVALFEGIPASPLASAYPIDLAGDADLATALEIFALLGYNLANRAVIRLAFHDGAV